VVDQGKTEVSCGTAINRHSFVVTDLWQYFGVGESVQIQQWQLREEITVQRQNINVKIFFVYWTVHHLDS
jgi:hypothetical protein